MSRNFKDEARALVAQMTVKEAAEQLVYDAPALPRLNIPAYNYWNEGLHGVARTGTATVFPQAVALAAMFDDELLEKQNTMRQESMKTVEFIRESHSGHLTLTFSEISAGEEDRRHMERIRSSLQDSVLRLSRDSRVIRNI